MEKIKKNIKDLYDDLKSYQQQKIDNFISNFNIINDLSVVTLSSENIICRKCKHNKFVKNGISNGIQRLKCTNCNSTQFHDANTPLYNMKLKDKWPDFVFIMLDAEQSKTCKNISKELEISTKTAHRWRHKFLSSLNSVSDLEILEETELDEVYFPFTVKGVIGKEKFDVYIAPDHKDNIESEFRIEEKQKEEEHFQSIYMCIHNRNSDFDFIQIKNQKKGIVSEADLTRIMQDIDISGKTIITDKEPSMKSFLRKKEGVNHLTFKSSDMKNGVIEQKNVHNNNINNTMMLLRNWMKDFFGVSTKYLLNYLKWFRFMRKFEIFKLEKMLKLTFLDKNSSQRFNDIFKDYVTFVRL
jgi:transposase-like protein